MTRRERWLRVAVWFLAASYGFGAPFAAVLEFRGHVLSQRFSYSPSLIYLTCAIQLVCAAAVLVPAFTPWAAATLTVITVGAVASHFKIGSPLTAGPALLYTILQVWVGLASRARSRSIEAASDHRD